MKTPNYNRIAGIYEEMARIFLGNRQERARKVFLDCLQNSNKVLIVGGGRGTVLSHLQELAIDLSVDFVDCSQKMIDFASQIECSNLSIKFYNVDINNLSNKQYDFIICQFFFDQFGSDSVLKMAKHLQKMLKPGGYLINTDFTRNAPTFKRLRNKLMMWFFRLVADTESWIFPNYEELLVATGFTQIKKIELRGAICAELYKYG